MTPGASFVISRPHETPEETVVVYTLVDNKMISESASRSVRIFELTILYQSVEYARAEEEQFSRFRSLCYEEWR